MILEHLFTASLFFCMPWHASINGIGGIGGLEIQHVKVGYVFSGLGT